MTTMPRRSQLLILTLIVTLAASAAACTSDNDNGASRPAPGDAAATSTTAPPTNVPVYAPPGPYKVGYTTLHMTDRDVAVWYPADDDAVEDQPKATYDQRAPLPDNLKALVPDEYNTVVTMEAYADVAGSADGPFPAVLLSHGFGGYRLVNSALAAGIASWGFVVASVDYLERGLVAQVTQQRAAPDPTRDPRLMLASLDLLGTENARAGSVLEGIVDAKRAGAVGHSAGGRTSFDALSDPRLEVAIGWAPSSPTGAPVAKPTMIIGAANDSTFTPADLTETYASFPAPKRRVELAKAGHNSFTDVCVAIRGGGGLVEFARVNHLFPESLLDLATNGCAASDPDPTVIWQIVQHFTVAELRSAFGIDPQPVGLGAGIENAFGEIGITYEEEAK